MPAHSRWWSGRFSHRLLWNNLKKYNLCWDFFTNTLVLHLIPADKEWGRISPAPFLFVFLRDQYGQWTTWTVASPHPWLITSSCQADHSVVTDDGVWGVAGSAGNRGVDSALCVCRLLTRQHCSCIFKSRWRFYKISQVIWGFGSLCLCISCLIQFTGQPRARGRWGFWKCVHVRRGSGYHAFVCGWSCLSSLNAIC